MTADVSNENDAQCGSAAYALASNYLQVLVSLLHDAHLLRDNASAHEELPGTVRPAPITAITADGTAAGQHVIGREINGLRAVEETWLT